MKEITVQAKELLGNKGYHPHRKHLVSNIKTWIKEKEPEWEFNRFGIAATGIFIQVTVAAIMLTALTLAGASVLLYCVGIFFAFMANSVAFAQAPMRWLLPVFALSILVNSVLALVYGIQLIF